MLQICHPRIVARSATYPLQNIALQVDHRKDTEHICETVNIFEFNSLGSFLKQVLKTKQEKNPLLSLRAWSSQLGFNSPSTLSRILNGKANMKLSVARKIATSLGLNTDEGRYLELLILLQEANQQEEKELIYSLMDEVKTRNPKQASLSMDAFSVISNWYHFAIKEMIGLKDFKEDSSWIAKKLLNEVPEEEILEAIERMLRLGIITRNPDNSLTKVDDALILLPNVPSAAIRSYHQQMLHLAETSIHSQTFQERPLYATTLSITKAQYEKLKIIIENMHKEILGMTTDKNADEVYQVCTQAFRLTGK